MQLLPSTSLPLYLWILSIYSHFQSNQILYPKLRPKLHGYRGNLEALNEGDIGAFANSLEVQTPWRGSRSGRASGNWWEGWRSIVERILEHKFKASRPAATCRLTGSAGLLLGVTCHRSALQYPSDRLASRKLGLSAVN